jgi:hypothetical protein
MVQGAQRGWWSRHWKWLVPVGCFGLILLVVAVVVIFVLLIGGAVLGTIKSSEVYEEALAAARSNAELRDTIGTPIEDGFFPSGSIETSGSSGTADLTIPISGPDGSATVYVDAYKSGDEWRYTRLEAEVEDSGRRIDLLNDTVGPGDPNGRRI